MKKSGGGIYNDGELILNKAKIYKNWCKLSGGGICTSSKAKFTYDKNEINDMVYNNKADQKDDDISPLIN